MTLGQKIKSARLERGLTQKELAGDAITRNMLSKIENDAAAPSVRTLEYLAHALDLPAGQLLFDPPERSIPDGLNEARDAFRRQQWEECLAALERDKDAASTDEGYLLHARAGACAAQLALERDDLPAARQLAEAALCYNQAGMYYDLALDAQLCLLLSKTFAAQGTEERGMLRRRCLDALDALGED